MGPALPPVARVKVTAGTVFCDDPGCVQGEGTTVPWGQVL